MKRDQQAIEPAIIQRSAERFLAQPKKDLWRIEKQLLWYLVRFWELGCAKNFLASSDTSK